jgi:D-alanyl-D-alanine dipeptidase
MKYSLALLLLAVFNCSQKMKQPAPPVNPPFAVDTAVAILPEPVKEALPLPPDYDTTLWTEVNRLEPGILLDLRYATDNNFVKEKMYDCPRCFLRPDVAQAVVAAHRDLQKKGFGLKMYDCYRPRPIQWKLWKKVPDERYVANPNKGSMHNRGMAVDLTIVDKNGMELNMGTGFDFFGEEAYHDYLDHPEAILENRRLLLRTMNAYGFRHTRTEWWHYSYIPKTFPLDDWLWKCK